MYQPTRYQPTDDAQTEATAPIAPSHTNWD